MTERLDSDTAEWPLRPWLLAGLCAVAGFIFFLLVDEQPGQTISIARQISATFVAVATLSFVVTVERLRWHWAAAFAVFWGLVIAFVGWFTAGYNHRGEIAEFPFLSGIFAVLIAAPLFQTVRDEGRWNFLYRRLHSHAWTDAVIGAASFAFVGVTFLLAFLIASLFDVIGIDLLKDLLNEGWFNWTLAGFAFGAAVGLLRERDRLVGTLQRLAMVVLSVLAPVLAAALAIFLLSIPFTGLQGLWESWVSAAALLLAASAGAVLLANAVIGDGREDKSSNPVLHFSAMVLIAVVLPLAALAGFAMGIRIGEYGWTPERIWGAIAVAVALSYGIAGWWAVGRGRRNFDELLRPLQTRLAIGLCALAVLLALPILDFGAISARSQIARLERGAIDAERFDWAAMAFDFGPAGRKRLRELAGRGPSAWRDRAVAALGSNERFAVAEQTRAATEAHEIGRNLRILSPGLRVTPDILRRIAMRQSCSGDAQCALLRVDQDRILVLSTRGEDRFLATQEIDLSLPMNVEVARPGPIAPKGIDLGTAKIELRTVARRQLHVNGQPVGEVIE